MKMAGSLMRGSPSGATYVSYWRLREQRDVDGIVAHRMGHMLASLHYNQGRGSDVQDWLPEAVAYYVSLGHLGRNSVTCFRWSQPSYAKPKRVEKEKTVQLGLRGYFNKLALSDGPPIDALVIKNLSQIGDADFAKAWSFFDYVGTRLGRPGQEWLRNTCSTASLHGRADFMRLWRKSSEQLFPILPIQEGGEGADVFAVIDQQWRAYAEGEQSQD